MIGDSLFRVNFLVNWLTLERSILILMMIVAWRVVNRSILIHRRPNGIRLTLSRSFLRVLSLRVVSIPLMAVKLRIYRHHGVIWVSLLINALFVAWICIWVAILRETRGVIRIIAWISVVWERMELLGSVDLVYLLIIWSIRFVWVSVTPITLFLIRRVISSWFIKIPFPSFTISMIRPSFVLIPSFMFPSLIILFPCHLPQLFIPMSIITLRGTLCAPILHKIKTTFMKA